MEERFRNFFRRIGQLGRLFQQRKKVPKTGTQPELLRGDESESQEEVIQKSLGDGLRNKLDSDTNSEEENIYMFSGKGGVYTNNRPDYSKKFAEAVLNTAGIENTEDIGNTLVISIGAGDGKDTLALLEAGCTVLAVEPSDDMYEKLINNPKLEQYKNEGKLIPLKAKASEIDRKLEEEEFQTQYPGFCEKYRNGKDERGGFSRTIAFAAQAVHTFSNKIQGNNDDDDKNEVKVAEALNKVGVDTFIPSCYNPTLEGPGGEFILALDGILREHLSVYRDSETTLVDAKRFDDRFPCVYADKDKEIKAVDIIDEGITIGSIERLQGWLSSYSFFPKDTEENQKSRETIFTAAEELFNRFKNKEGELHIPFTMRVLISKLVNAEKLQQEIVEGRLDVNDPPKPENITELGTIDLTNNTRGLAAMGTPQNATNGGIQTPPQTRGPRRRRKKKGTKKR